MAVPSEKGIPLSALSPKFLHTNSTSHTWPFSAIAELIDNAYDPDVKARQFWIDKTKVKDQDCLIFMDNGAGMDYDKMHKLLSFGFSDKQAINGHVPVGLYGNGFKSGSMRLGKDAIVFSKKARTMCVGLLSQTYLQNIGAEHVVVPIATFKYTDWKICPELEHAASLKEIMCHSLFQTEEEIFSELKAFNGFSNSSSGTRIIIWNLRKTTSGTPEFDFVSDRYDIRIPVEVYESTNEQNRRLECGIQSTPQSTYSLRAYCSILYLKPRMKIIIRGQKVKTQLVSKSLAHIIKDKYKPQFLPNQTIPIVFGYNTKSKEQYGIMMYHKNRLIKAYERVGCQLKANTVGVGVIGVIECDFLKPTHNKQDFDSTDEYRKTITNVGIKLEEYWREVRHRLKSQDPDCTLPVEDTVKRPDQNWVQCDGCLKWRKLPDCINTDKLPDKWFCHMNPDPQFRSCTANEEQEDSDDEQAGYQKTYKQHERNKRLQQERTRLQMVEQKKNEEQKRIAALTKQNAVLMKKQQDLERQLRLSAPSSPNTPAKSTSNSCLTSSPLTCAGSMPTINMPVISNVISLSTTPKREKRGLSPSQENEEAKRPRLINGLCNKTSNSPSMSTASPEACSSPTMIIPDDDDDGTEVCRDNETAQNDDNDDDDDDIVIIESSSTPRPKKFDLSKVKLECRSSEDTEGIHISDANVSSETSLAMETTAAATSSPPTEQVSITTQTDQISVKEEVENSEGKKEEERDSSKLEREQGISTLEKKTNQDPKEKSTQGSPQAQLINVTSQTERGEKDESKSNCAADDEVLVKSELEDVKPNSEELSTASSVEAGESSAKHKDLFDMDNLSVSVAQKPQDVLLELLEAMSQERDKSRAEAQLLTSRVEELQKSLLELTQPTVKKEQCQKSTQTIPADEEEQDYKALYLEATEKTKQLQHELDKLKTERAEMEVQNQGQEKVEGHNIAENNVQSKGSPAMLDMCQGVDDELACQVDHLLRELDDRNKEREELKSKLGSLEDQKKSLVACCNKLQKDLEELKRRSEESKVSVAERGAQTELVIPGENEATSAGSSNPGTSDSGNNADETQERPEREGGQDDKTMLAGSIRLRELRQKVGRLLVTFVPALDLEQVNYDCEVIDEILSQVIDEISPTVK